MRGALQILLSGLIDYAGLFPPASLDLRAAVDNFERYQAGQFAWALGCFVVPASRLDDLGNPSLPLSVLAGSDLDRDLTRISRFADRHPNSIKSIEVKAVTVESVRAIALLNRHQLPTFIEIPIAHPADGLLSAIGEAECRAKIRTGGLTSDAFPPATDLARFLTLASELSVPFKATAGLHHPMRGLHNLTYDPQSPSAVMHGFLNVFLASAFVRNRLAAELVTELIEEQSPDAFQFDDDSVVWRTNRLTQADIASTRNDFAMSFGSCSFEEPIQDLRSMGLL